MPTINKKQKLNGVTIKLSNGTELGRVKSWSPSSQRSYKGVFEIKSYKKFPPAPIGFKYYPIYVIGSYYPVDFILGRK